MKLFVAIAMSATISGCFLSPHAGRVLGKAPPTRPPEPRPAPVGESFRAAAGRLYDPCGAEVRLWGANAMVVWNGVGSSFEYLRSIGANTVRIVWEDESVTYGNYDQSPTGLDKAISGAWANRLLPMVELHDATGKWSAYEQVHDYWTRDDVLKVILQHQQHLLLNIANEAGDYSVPQDDFVRRYSETILALRDAGVVAPIVIDSRGWAHDVPFLASVAPQLIAIDPRKNLMFSTHQYIPSNHSSYSADYFHKLFGQLGDLDLTWVLGEFGPLDWTCKNEVDVHGLMVAAMANGVDGVYPWSIGPGNTPCGAMDMLSSSGKETTWGRVARRIIEENTAPISCPAR